MSIYKDMTNTMTEIQDMVEDFKLCFEDDITPDMPLDQLMSCLKTIKEKCVPPAPISAPKVEPISAPKVEPVPVPNVPAPIPAPKVESTLKVATLTEDNYVTILNELLLKLTHEGDYDFFGECLEEAWSLNIGDDLNDNLDHFETTLKDLRQGKGAEPVVQSDETGTQEIDMSLFDNYTWFRDENHNGDPKAIFTHALQVDPTTCTLKDFVHGLSYARTVKDGKDRGLTSKELTDLVMARGTFTDATLPTRKNGAVIKTKVWPMIRDIREALKDEHNSKLDKKALKDLTGHSYQTSATYREEFLDTCVTPTETPTADLDGDTLDEMALNVNVDDLKMNIDYAMGEEEQEEAPLTAMELLMRD